MKLAEMSNEEILTELYKEFSHSQLTLAGSKLTNLIKTSETLDQLVARIYETVNIAIETRQVDINKTINRLDTRKDSL